MGESSSLPWAPGCPCRDSVPRPEHGITQACCCRQTQWSDSLHPRRIIHTFSHQQRNVHLSVDPRLRTSRPDACTRSYVNKSPGTPAPLPLPREKRVESQRHDLARDSLPRGSLIQSPPTKQHRNTALRLWGHTPGRAPRLCRGCASGQAPCSLSGREGAAEPAGPPVLCDTLHFPVLHYASTKDTRNPNLFTKY